MVIVIKSDGFIDVNLEAFHFTIIFKVKITIIWILINVFASGVKIVIELLIIIIISKVLQLFILKLLLINVFTISIKVTLVYLNRLRRYMVGKVMVMKVQITVTFILNKIIAVILAMVKAISK